MGEILLPDKRPMYPYRTDDGRVLRRSEVNFHHAAWERKMYTSKRDRYYREMGGMVLPMVITWHDDLHANLRPPAKPPLRLMDQVIDYGRELAMPNPYESFSQITKFIIRVSETSASPEIADAAQKLGANFILQSAFIDKGMVYPNGA